MSFLREEDILTLSQASREYNRLFNDPIDNDASLYKDLDKFTFGQTASILRGNYGWDTNPTDGNNKELNDEEFITGWITHPDHPERRDFIPFLDANLAETLFPLKQEDEPSGLSKRLGGFEDIAFSLYANAPAWFIGSAGSVDKWKLSPMTFNEIDWSQMGKKLFHGDVGGMKDEVIAGYDRYKAKYDAGKYDALANRGIPRVVTRRGLQEMEKLLAERAKSVMDEHQQDPKNQAYWQYMKQVRAKDLLYGDDTMSFPEKLDYSIASLVSPLMTIGTGIVVGALSRNPALGMQVASSGAFLLEGIDEWQQSFDYYIKQGYAPEQASRMSHANAILYGTAAYYTEKLPASRFIKGANKIAIKKKLWDGIVKKTGEQVDKAFLKSPLLKTVVTNRGTQLIKTAAANSMAEALEESVQLTTQTAIQYGYKGNEAFEGYSEELRESARAGGTAGFLMGPLGAGISGITERFIEQLPEEPTQVPITEFDRDKIKIASVINRISGLTKEEKKFAGTLDAEERGNAQGFLDSLKKTGPDILNDLGISSNELVQEVKSLFGPETAAAAKNILSEVVTPTTEEEADTGQPPSPESVFGAAGISDAELERRLAEEEEGDIITPEVEDYEALKGEALKDELRRRGLKVGGKVDELKQRLRDDDATRDVVEEPVPIDMGEGEIVYADPETGRPYTAEEIAEIEKDKEVVEEVPAVTPVEETTFTSMLPEDSFRVKDVKEMSLEELKVEIESKDNPISEAAKNLINQEISLREQASAEEAPAEGPMNRLEYVQHLLDNDPTYQQVQKDLKKAKSESDKPTSRKADKIVYSALKKELRTIEDKFMSEKVVPVREKGFDYRTLIKEEAPAEGKDLGDQMDIQFQAIDQGRLPKITEKREWADRVITSLKERFPKIEGREVEKIVNKLTDTEQAGRAFNMIAEWSKSQATIDTAPHEYAHILIDAMEDSPVIQKAIGEFKTKEALVQYMGEYYADGMQGHDKGVRSRFKTFLRKFWARVKKVFGKPAEYIAQQFAEGGEMFQEVDNIAALQYKLRGQKTVNEASMELARLKREHGVTIKRHPTDPTRLGTIKVPKAKRREGIGRQVIDALKKEFIGKGKDLINIEVNPGSEGFWEKMGFTFVEATKEGYPIMPEENTSTINPPTEPYGRWRMEYRIPDEEMTLGPIEYQMISPETEGGRMATRMLDNTLNAMQAQLGKKFVIQDFIDKIASTIPSSFAEVFTNWAGKHVNIEKVAKGMAVFDVYATPEEFSSAFYDVTDALNEDLASIEPNDFAIRAKNMATVEYAFMNALGIDIPRKNLNALYLSSRQYAAQTGFTPQEAFEKWGDTALYDATGFKYSDFPDTDKGRKTKRRIKQLYVTNNSRVRINPGSALIPRHRNLEYNASGDGLVWKTNEAKWTKKSNDTSALNYLYEAVNADRNWNQPGGGPVWLNLSDIYERYSRGKSHWFDKKSAVLTPEEMKALAKKALNMKLDGTGPRIYGLSMLSVRGDSGHFIFAPILQQHMDLVARLSKLELYWKSQVKAGNITLKQMYHFLGRRQNADGTWRDLPNAADTRWLAGEVARYEMMSNMMPKDLNIKEGKGAMSWMSKGSEFFRRIKILSTPVFTSPMMRDTKAMIIAQGDEKGEIWFVDRHGNEAPMVDVIRGLGQTNRTDGASIIGRTFTNDMTDAFGADPKKKLFKTAIWKADLSLAVKHEMFLPESGMQIIRVKPNGERVTVATVDDTGNIFNADGQEIDILMTDDEAKHSAYKSGETIDIKGNELGLIKYHESKINRAKFPHQWLNYVNDPELLKKIKAEINPRINRGLNRLFNLTSSDKMRPSILAQYMINLRSDSPGALTTALIEKALLGLGLHPDAHPMLNKILKTQIIDPTLQLADGKGMYLDIAPDYFDTHKGNDVSISQADARQVYKAYAKKEGGTWQDAQNIGLNAINKWLEDNDVNALVSRSPIPYVGGVFVGRIKSVHDRGGQLIMSSEHAIRRLEGDNDGDAVQVEFLPDDLLADIDTFLSANSNRMGAVNLDSYPVELEEVNDLSRIENVYNIASKFQKGSRAIGEIANLQNVFGQMQQVFNYIELEDGSRIRVHNLSDEVYFPEIKETKTMEEQLRIWLQSAVDNGKHLLLDKWDYSRDTLISRLFYIENPDGTTREIPAKEMKYDIGFKEDRPSDTKEASIIKALVKLHVMPGRIRNGRQPGFTYDVKTLLAESNAYLAYTRNRNAFINDLLTSEISVTSENRAINMSFGKINEISFTDEVAPLEEIAISFAKMWYGTENVDARIEPGKLTPVEFEPGVYKTVHLNTMRELEENRDTMFQDRIDQMDSEELPARDQATLEAMMKKGRNYANAMWLDKEKGFIKLLEEFGESIGPSSWDHNPQLIDWTTHWSNQFQELNEFEQTVATYTFLRGFAQKNAESKLIFDDNRNVLPPVSDKADFTVLDHKLMKQYLNMYNSNLRKHQERTENFRRVSYDSFNSFIKKACR